jgi:hypothetical protein
MNHTVCNTPIAAHILFPSYPLNKIYTLLAINRTKAGIVQSLWQPAMGWKLQGSNPRRGEIYLARPDRHWNPNQDQPLREFEQFIGTG